MLFTFGETSLRLAPPGQGRLETAPRYDVGVTGAESNAAVTAARLGVETVWCSKLPDSPLGRRVAGGVRDHGVEPAVTWGEGRIGVRYGERAATPRPPIDIDDGADAAVTTTTPEELALDRLEDARILYTTAGTMALSTSLVRTTAHLLKRAHDDGVRTAFNLAYRGPWSVEEARETLTGLFPAVDVLIANESDLRTVLGRDGTPSEMAHGVAKRHDFEEVVIARDERGGVAWKDATLHERRPPETQLVDPHGAVDAFAGAYLARLHEGTDTDAALSAGVAAAAIARTVETAVAPITPDELAEVQEQMHREGQ